MVGQREWERERCILLDVLHLDVSVLFVAHKGYLLQSSMYLFVTQMRELSHLRALILWTEVNRCSNSPVIFYNDKLRLVRFVFNCKNLGRTEIDNLPYFCEQRQSRPLVENVNSTIAVSLLKNVGAGEYTVSACDTLLGIRDHAHAITSF
jgi:hypothetical protein